MFLRDPGLVVLDEAALFGHGLEVAREVAGGAALVVQVPLRAEPALGARRTIRTRRTPSTYSQKWAGPRSAALQD